ncbi:MAG: TRAP transporter small permease subunit [Oleibacter sp.]|nr:TRAP transporter small permease subunit [Thalassolituus sp.]
MRQKIISNIDRITLLTGQGARWLALLMVVATCAIVAMRYAFDRPSIALQEGILYLHATLFMLGAAYTWQQGGHVRVDVFHRNWSRIKQQWVERVGIFLFVLPVCVFMIYVSWTYVSNAWAIREGSPETSGIPLVYLLKTLLLALPLLLILQAIAEFLRTFTPIETPKETASESPIDSDNASHLDKKAKTNIANSAFVSENTIKDPHSHD